MNPMDPVDASTIPILKDQFEQPSPGRRLFAPRFAAIVAFTIIGGVLGGRFGLAAGCFIGLIYVSMAAIAAGHYSLDLHEGEVLDNYRAPETFKLTEEMAGQLGIEPPSIYSIAVERPQMCVSAVGIGRHVRGRIGVSRALLQQADEIQLKQLVALAMARLWTGEASIMSSAAAISGLPLQFAQWRPINGSPDWKMYDMECGLSPVGKFFLIIFAPFARLTLSLAGAMGSVLRSDQAALRLGQRHFHPHGLESAIRWLHDQQSPVVRDPITEYNPAETALFLVSPFEVDFQNARAGDDLPMWKRARFLVTSVVPHLDARIQRIHDRADALSSNVVDPVAEAPRVVSNIEI